MHELTMNDFFCGCGGMTVAFRNAGYRIVGAWDFDKYAVQSYRENLGGYVKEMDIREMTWADVPPATVWAFGFPCQDLSYAGKQAGFVFTCNDCRKEWSLLDSTRCPNCGGQSIKAKTRSAMFFEMMRLLEETEGNAPERMPAILVAENVKGLKKYIPTLMEELRRHGYLGHIELYNSKHFGVAQNRERYYIIAIRHDLPDTVKMPSKQEEHGVPRLTEFLDETVDEKYYLPDDKAQAIIRQALQKIESLGNAHPCLTPDRLNKRQNGPRAKSNEAEMFTLTAQDIHGVIIQERKGVSRDATKYISDKLLEFVEKKGYVPKFFNPYNCSDCGELAPTVTTACGGLTTSATVLVLTDRNNGEPVSIQLLNEGKAETAYLDCVVNDRGFVNRPAQVTPIAPTLRAQDHGNQPKVVEVGSIREYRVRKLTPSEYGRLQAFPVDTGWKQVVSDARAYSQFGNAVTTTVAQSIAEAVKQYLLEID